MHRSNLENVQIVNYSGNGAEGIGVELYESGFCQNKDFGQFGEMCGNPNAPFPGIQSIQRPHRPG